MRKILRPVFRLAFVSLLLPRFLAAQDPAPEHTEARAITPVIKDEHRHKEFVARIRQGPVRLLFLGDSITDGWRGGGKKTWEKFEKYRPANFGIGGDRTEHVLWRLENGELERIRPKVIVLMIGTNNIGHTPPDKPEWAAAGVEKIVDTIHEKLPETKILLLAVFPRDGKGSDRRRATEQINEFIAKLGDREYVEYLSINDAFLDENGELPKEIMPDSLHLSEQGYELWYEAMSPTLEKMMRN